jgi:hypothetical protein
VGLIAFAVTLLYVHAPGGFTVPRWALLAIVIPFFWYFRPSKWTSAHSWGLLFLAYCALSLTWTFSAGDGYVQLGRFILLALIFLAGAGTRDLKWVWVGGAFGVAANSVLITGQVYAGWDFVPQAAAPAGTFFNKNIAAETAAIVAVGVLGVPRWRWLALGALPAIWLCQTRGIWAALAVAGIVLIWQHYRRLWVLAVLGGLCGAAGVYALGWSHSGLQRLQVWQDTFAGLTVFGRGVGSFWATFPEHATRIDPLALRPENAHNDFLQLIYEVGPASLAIIGLFVFAFQQRLRAEHYALIVFIVAGLVGFPLYMPATAFFAALALGHVCGLRSLVHAPHVAGKLAPVHHAKPPRDAVAAAAGWAARALGPARALGRGVVRCHRAALRRP